MHASITLAVCLTSGLGAAATLATGATGATPTTRYVSPGGSGSTCSKPSPCELFDAVAASGPGDTVILTPGTYPSKSGAYDSTLETSTSSLTIEGEPGAKTPIIRSTADEGALDVDIAVLRDLEVRYSGVAEDAAVELASSTGSQLTVIADMMPGGNPANPACGVTGFPSTLSDSLCEQVGTNGSPAVGVYSNGNNFHGILNNVTAIGSGPNSVGLLVDQIGNGADSIDATNSIILGAGTDVVAEGNADGTATVNLSHCDFKTTQMVTGGAIPAGSGNTSSNPKFVDAAGGDFRERPASPTVNQGSTTVVRKHDLDLAGNPRILGSKPDIGAYELPEKPAVHGLSITGATHSLHGKVTVNGEGLSTKIQVVASDKHGHTKVFKAHKRVTRSATVHFTIRGLKPRTRYRLQIVAKNHAGVTKSKSAKTITRG